MDTLTFLDKLLTVVNEIIWPSLGLWVAYLVRRWVAGTLTPPAYEHKVTLTDQAKK